MLNDQNKQKKTEKRETPRKKTRKTIVGIKCESQTTKRFLMEAILDNAKPSKNSFDIIAFLSTKIPHTSANPRKFTTVAWEKNSSGWKFQAKTKQLLLWNLINETATRQRVRKQRM